jgi:hypothetical protein
MASILYLAYRGPHGWAYGQAVWTLVGVPRFELATSVLWCKAQS